jgi:hypothetical protein
MGKHDDDVPGRRARTFQEAANELATSLTTLFRARSHGLIRVVQFGKRPIIPASEFERLAREGLPLIPPGYKRLTARLSTASFLKRTISLATLSLPASART